MALTLSVIAGLALLLPGLFGVLFWNFRARRHSASRPDLPITAVSVLAFAIALSMLVHTATWYLIYVVRLLAVEAGDLVGSYISPAIYVPQPLLQNPIETIVALTHGSATAIVQPIDVAAVALTILAEIAFVFAVVTDEGFDLLLEDVDLGNQGWVHSHIIRPAQNGYRPIAYVLTTLRKDGLGVGFRGVVADIRQSDRGETLSLSLSDPERFLYELKPGKSAKLLSKPADPKFIRHEDEAIGSVLSLEARAIENVVVSNPQARRLDRLRQLLDAGGVPAEQT
ncbi:hypothetical protein [Sphingomonas sp. PAMC 26621]|uniref:hypothetical protein n=1 Tax=Sphingomonas sp. PAMC 26621 TaxID=1112213 RepID=UPI00028A0411|nr:hypothetical protein [Sphingomonas sp. PAMC 26621]